MPSSDEEAPPVKPTKRVNEATPLLPDACLRSTSSSPWQKSSPKREAQNCCYVSQCNSETRRLIFIAVLAAGLVSIGVAAGMKLEGWRFVTALYFIVQVVTTIGYGDLTPTHDLMKLFCSIYILCSLVVLAYVFNLVAQQLARMHTNFIRKRLRVLEAMVFKHASAEVWKDQGELDKMHKKMKDMYGRFNKLVAATFVIVFFLVFGTVFYRLFESCSCSYGKTRVVGCSSESHATCVSTGGFVQTWCSAFYMSVVTLTTVGFGDHTPKSEIGRVVGVFWMLFGVASMANWVAKLSEFFIQEQLKRDDFIREEINEKTFKSMDVDGDGYLSRSEYRSYVLVRYGLVSQGELDTIDTHYNLLDKGRTERVTYAMVQEAQKAQDVSPPSNVSACLAHPVA